MTRSLPGVLLLALFGSCTASELKEDPNLPYVVAHCTACHSSALITQNRMTREGWLQTIRWMQKKQGLWPLGDHEVLVLDYLEKHYFPENSGRRKPIAPHLMPNP